jgi:rubredoxin
MESFKCQICGYIYNPDEGDADRDIAPGTSFSELPDDYECPVCSAGKDEFFVID